MIMKKLKIFFQLWIVLTLVGCTAEQYETTGEKAITNLVATLPPTTRTHLNSTAVEWDVTDELGVFSDAQSAITRYTYSSKADNGAIFKGDKVEGTTSFYAIYPYNAASTVNGTKVTYTLPSKQPYVQGSFAPGICPMAATSSDQNFFFKQTCGLIRLNLTGNGTVKKIVLQGNNNEVLAGTGEIDLAATQPEFSISANASETSKSISVDCDIQLSATATVFYFVIPAQNFTKGLNITVSGTFDGQEKELVKNTDKLVEVSRAMIKNFTVVDTDELLNEGGNSQRDVLVAFYEAMGGDKWTKKTNWCTDADLSQWEGVSVDYQGNVIGLYLRANNLVGEIPACIGELTKLTLLSLDSNEGITGSIPETFFNLTELNWIDLSYCQLSGTIPTSFVKLEKLEYLFLEYNKLSGDIPKEVSSMPIWQRCGWGCVSQRDGYGFTFSTFNLTLQNFTYPVLGGGSVNSLEVASSHQYTVVYVWATGCSFSMAYHPTLAGLYSRYKNHGLDVIGICFDGKENTSTAESLIQSNKMDWHNILQDIPEFPIYSFPTVLMFDKDGKLVFHSSVHNRETLPDKLKELLGEGDTPQYYESTDYSKDGKVVTLQTATQPSGGAGIDIVMMGDGFSDRKIADGDYERVMREGMEAFFSEEPYRSFRDYFNVYYVIAVSKNEEYMPDTETKFGCSFGEGTYVEGNDNLCFEYAQKVPGLGAKGLDDALIIVMLNSARYAGTCFMYYNTGMTSDYGRGVSVAYFPIGTSSESLSPLLLHEAGGHGFAKLDDEYAYEYRGEIPSATVSESISLYENFGWGKNVDFTSDPTQVRWTKFLSDSRYANQGLGVFEGACTYWKGAYRPTDNSIMNTNTGGFNAPSREAIYYRIHKLAYGENWTYDYESFVEWDAKNRSVTRVPQVPRKDFVPLHPPVKIQGTWKH
jgi:thiol-disulfide isomerase/thioredoxin